ncbi:hypothetical protein Trydic_g9558 [Trypoxylus dichotomus]
MLTDQHKMQIMAPVMDVLTHYRQENEFPDSTGEKTHNWEVVVNSFHSPDLAPSDFYLLEPLEAHLSSKRFEDNDELLVEVRQYFKNLDRTFLEGGMQKPVLRRH